MFWWDVIPCSLVERFQKTVIFTFTAMKSSYLTWVPCKVFHRQWVLFQVKALYGNRLSFWYFRDYYPFLLQGSSVTGNSTGLILMITAEFDSKLTHQLILRQGCMNSVPGMVEDWLLRFQDSFFHLIFLCLPLMWNGTISYLFVDPGF